MGQFSLSGHPELQKDNATSLWESPGLSHLPSFSQTEVLVMARQRAWALPTQVVQL